MGGTSPRLGHGIAFGDIDCHSEIREATHWPVVKM